MRKLIPWALSLAVSSTPVVLVPSEAIAGKVALKATVDGSQANGGAGAGSPGTGYATLTLDTDSNRLQWAIVFWGLQGSVTTVEIQAPVTQNRAIEWHTVAVSGRASPSVGSTNITGPQKADLLAGRWYLNIRSTVYPDGEIRGQVRRGSFWGRCDAIGECRQNRRVFRPA